MADEIAAACSRIETWLSLHAPSWVEQQGPRPPLFRQPAEEKEIEQLEAHCRVQLPDRDRRLWRLHDGCRKRSYPIALRPAGRTWWRILSISEVAHDWDLRGKIAAAHPFGGAARTIGPVRRVWWNVRWIPIAEDGTGDFVCLDMDPAEGGKPGQLVLYMHDSDERQVIHSSLSEWLCEFADDLERGDYVFVDDVIELRAKEDVGEGQP
jgi:cell wall assembly regulator SMI1